VTVLDEPADVDRHQGRRRRLAWATAVVAAATAAAAAGWWATHPTALQSVGNRIEVPGQVGGSVVVTMFAQPESGDVRLLAAEPVVTPDSADAEVRTILCENPAELPGSTIVGTELGTAEHVCETTRPAHDAELGRASPTTPYLVVEVTPRAPGTVTVEGLRVRYRTGLQQGVQDSGFVVTVRTP
jgi:hypothetical protein